MMKLLPFIPEAVIVGNGEFPSHPFPLHILETVSYVICCDGGADAFVHHTDRVPDWIIGDGDSLSEENRRRFQSIIRYNPDQETNDLTKSVLFLQERGIHRIVIVAATGKREDHTLGNISLLMEYHRQGLEIMMLTDYGFLFRLPILSLLSALRGSRFLYSVSEHRGCRKKDWYILYVTLHLGGREH